MPDVFVHQKTTFFHYILLFLLLSDMLMKVNGGFLRMKSSLLALVCVLFSVLPVSAQSIDDMPVVRYVTMADGLPGNFIDDIHKDSAGFVWLAMQGGGLSRYDGYGFVNFSTHSENPIRSNFVRYIAEDPFRRLWIASDAGIDVIDMTEMTTCPTLADQVSQYVSWQSSRVSSDSAGNIWIAADGIAIMISFDGAGNIVGPAVFKDSRISSRTAYIEDVEKDGTMWINLGGQMFRLSADAGSDIRCTRVLPAFAINPDTYISDALVNGNELWLSSEDGLFRYNLLTDQYRHYRSNPSDPRSLTQNFVTGLVQTRDGQMVVSTLKGVNIYEPVTDDFTRVNSSSSGFRGSILGSDFVNCIREYDGQIWIGTESAGLTILGPRRLDVENRAFPNPANSMYSDASGALWVGIVEGGLYCIPSDQSAEFTLTRGNSALSHNSVSALASDPDGTLWIGTWGGGLNALNVNRKGAISHMLDASIGLPVDYIGALAYDDSHDVLWIGSNLGIFIYDIKTGNISSALDDHPTGCLGACFDAGHRLWIGTQTGAYVFDTSMRLSHSDRFPYVIVSQDWISSLMCASDGSVWAGTNGNGLCRFTYDSESDRFVQRRFSSDQGLINDSVRGVVEDKDGFIWVATENGLSRLDPVTGTSVNYGTDDGLASSQFYWNAYGLVPDGRICFGSVDGITIVNPYDLKDDSSVSSLRFTTVSIDGLVRNVVYSDEVRLHQRDKSAEFEFALLNYGRGNLTAYSYRLKGYDDSWTDLKSERHFVSFSSLPAGRYMLQVRALGPGNIELGNAEIAVKVKPYFYKTWWFLLIVMTFVASSIYLGVQRRTRQLMRQREQLRETVKERTKEILDQQLQIEQKAAELERQNIVLKQQNEELASHKLLVSDFSPKQGDGATRDDEFLAKAMETIRELYKDPELDVEKFSLAMGVSKSLLNKKLQALTQQSTGNFIRKYRLSVAREIIVHNRTTRSMNIAEIAYEVGFNDPKYFTRCFSQEFGMSPSSMMNETQLAQ